MFQHNYALHLEEFENHLLAYKRIGMSTASGYRGLIAKILRDLGTIGPSHRQLENYVVALRKGKLGYSHQRNVILAIEAYTGFLGDPLRLGRPPKSKPIIKDTLSEAEIILILYAAKNARERALVSLLAYSGIRCNELTNVRVRDVDFGANLVRVIGGKGKEDRIVCIAPECCRLLLDYLSKYPRAQGEFLFTATRSGARLSTWAVRKTVRKIAARTLPGRRVHPHLFRHSLATCMLNRGANLMTIKEQLGHSFIDTTMIYVRSSFPRIEAEYRLYAPRLV
jgi:integrase/recombinase XerD